MEENASTSTWMGEKIEMMKGLESLSDGEEQEDNGSSDNGSFDNGSSDNGSSNNGTGSDVGEDRLSTSNEGREGHYNEDIRHIDSMDDILCMDLAGLSPHQVRNIDFPTREVRMLASSMQN